MLAVTVFAESVPPRDAEGDDRSRPTPLITLTPADSVTLMFSDDPDTRLAETHELIDRTLIAAVDRFFQQVG